MASEGKGRLHQVFCYRAEDETGRWHTVEQEEKYEIHINLLAALGEVALALLRVACWG